MRWRLTFLQGETIVRPGRVRWVGVRPGRRFAVVGSRRLCEVRGTDDEVVLGCEMDPVAGHGEEGPAHDAVVESPLYYFEGGDAEDDLEDEPDVEDVDEGGDPDVVVVGEEVEVGEVEAVADGVGEGGEAVAGEGHPLLDVLIG